ncbi:MAG: hypothetical protein K8R17_00145 [Methanosarcinales archaeon]|nr:hypothetical protein [Methanosarcinales archaeon]
MHVPVRSYLTSNACTPAPGTLSVMPTCPMQFWMSWHLGRARLGRLPDVGRDIRTGTTNFQAVLVHQHGRTAAHL